MRYESFTLCFKRTVLNETSMGPKTRKSKPSLRLVNHGAEISSIFEDPKAMSEAILMGELRRNDAQVLLVKF